MYIIVCFEKYVYTKIYSASARLDISTHDSSTLCFHKLTLWSPVETANTVPVTDQLNLQTGASKLFNKIASQGPEDLSCFFQIYTVRSSEQLANTL